MASDTDSKSAARRAVSPRARRLARRLGVQWSDLSGTGSGGRIRERDVREASAAAEPPVDFERATVMTARIDVAPLLQLVEALTGRGVQGDLPLGPLDVLCKAAAAALMLHRAVRPEAQQEAAGGMNVACAVGLREALSFPVIVGAEQLSLRELAVRRLDLLDLARARRLDYDQPASIAVSDLSALGLEQFAPPLPQPAVAGLAVGRIVRGPAAPRGGDGPGGELQISETSAAADRRRAEWVVSLGYDAQQVPLLAAARYLAELRRLLESPDWLLSG